MRKMMSVLAVVSMVAFASCKGTEAPVEATEEVVAVEEVVEAPVVADTAAVVAQ